MKKLFLALAAGLFTSVSFAQGVKIAANPGAPDPSAQLEVDAANKGLLLPRVDLLNTTDGVTILLPATSLVVYNMGNTLSPAGMYYNSGTPQAPQWVLLFTSPANDSLDMNQFPVTNVPLPVNGSDAVNKDYVDNAILQASGGGQMPTEMSAESPNSMTIRQAMEYCSNLTENGNSDWKFPTLEEIYHLMFTDIASIPNNTSGNNIWTCDMYNPTSTSTYYMYIRISDGYYYKSTSNTAYTASNYVRCVR